MRGAYARGPRLGWEGKNFGSIDTHDRALERRQSVASDGCDFGRDLNFLGREWLEFRRRRAAKKRRVAAIKAILARNCELNHWATKSLTRILRGLCTEEGQPMPDLRVEFRRNGQPILRE